MIIDCHTHLNRYDDAAPASLAERYARLSAEMEANGVDHALVLSSYVVNDRRPSTRELLELVADDSRLGIVAGVSTLRDLTAEVAELRELLEARRIRGIKLYPGYESFYVHDRRLHPLYELAAEFGAPVMIHTGDTFYPRAKVKYAHPLEVDDVAVDFREVTFLVCHLGSPWFTDAMEVVYKNENVVADISGFTLGEFAPRYEEFVLNRMREVLAFVNDPTKLLFGTDWPISDIGSYLRFVEKLDLTEEEREGLFWRNAARVFRLEVGRGEEGAGHG